MNFCGQCGKPVNLKIPTGDNRKRHVCGHCDTIHYQNPRVISGCIPVVDDSVLLCRRAIEPRYGLWTLPAGFLENGETVLQGALRECWEEALAKLNEPMLSGIYDIPHINQVYILYRGHCTTVVTVPGTSRWTSGCSARQIFPGRNWLSL